jgi:hypothetical protein
VSRRFLTRPVNDAMIPERWMQDDSQTRKLYPGDYNRAEAGSADQRVWSETGCTCVLLTSTRDVLR